MRLLALMVFCVSLSLAQTNDRIDSVRVIMITPEGVIPLQRVEVYVSGAWRFFGYVLPTQAIAGLVDTVVAHSGGTALPTEVDSLIWAKKWWVLNGLDGKQRAGIYLVPQDTASLRSGLDGKAATNHTHPVVADTGAFTTTAVRTAIYIVGCRDNQIWMATPRKPHATLLPVAGDFLAASPKWDSLVVKRAAGTTSGLKFNYFRIK